MNDVNRVLKVLEEEGITNDKITVKYDLRWRDDNTSCRAYIFHPTENCNTGNGHERTYSCQLIKELIKLYDKYNVNFHIGHTDNLEMHIQVYVTN